MSLFEKFEFTPLAQLDASRRVTVEALLAASPQPLSGYTWAMLSAWDPMFSYRVAAPGGDTLLISFANLAGERHLLQPLGAFGRPLSATLLDRAARLPYLLQIACASEAFVGAHPDLQEAMEVGEDRSASNYLYRASDLVDLPGKAYSPKRNHLAQARAAFSWTVEPLESDQAIAECMELSHELRPELGLDPDSLPCHEHRALLFTLERLRELKQEGLLIRVEGRVEAFALFEPIAPKMAAIHFERARRALKGLHQVINWEAARLLRERGFELINREEDVGHEGLRKAKLSYHPVRIEPAYTFTLRR